MSGRSTRWSSCDWSSRSRCSTAAAGLGMAAAARTTGRSSVDADRVSVAKLPEVVRQPRDVAQGCPLVPQLGVGNRVEVRAGVSYAFLESRKLCAVLLGDVEQVAVGGFPVHVYEVPLDVRVLLAQPERMLDQLIGVEIARSIGAGDRLLQRL